MCAQDEPNVWRFMAHIASALEYLHGQHPPVIHRDLKPDNILAKTEDGGKCFKIADFGVARFLGENAYGEYYARSEAGTPIYMAPEALAVSIWILHGILLILCFNFEYY